MENSEVSAEIEALSAIYGDDELAVETKNDLTMVISMKCKISQDNEERKNIVPLSVLVELQIGKEAHYPCVSPAVQLKKPRGLQEEDISELQEKISCLLSANLGMPVLYEVFQLVKDYLTEHEGPEISCHICLSQFSSEDQLSATDCGHYFHQKCLGKYLEGQWEDSRMYQSQLAPHLIDSYKYIPKCPVCRCDVPDLDFETLLKASTPIGSPIGNNDFDWLKWKEEQKKMNVIFERQKEKGGIIDLDFERKRLLVTEDTTIILPSSSPEPQEEATSSTQNEPTTVTNHFRAKTHYRGQYYHRPLNRYGQKRANDFNQELSYDDINKKEENRPNYRGRTFYRRNWNRGRRGRNW